MLDFSRNFSGGYRFSIAASFVVLMCSCKPSTSAAPADPGNAGEPAAKAPVQAKTEGAAADLPPGYAVQSDGLRTAGQPSAAQLESLAQAGLTTVINLQAEDEAGVADEKMAAAALGLHYVSLPTAAPGDITREQAVQLDAVLRDATPATTLLHCGSSNRVGALLALRAYYLQQRSEDEALAIGKAAGLTRLEEHVRNVMKQNPR